MAAKKKAAGQGRSTAKRTPAFQVAASGEAVTQLATRVPQQLYKELKLYAVTNTTSIADCVAEAIVDFLNKQGWKPQLKKAS